MLVEMLNRNNSDRIKTAYNNVGKNRRNSNKIKAFS